jgi:small GTP-binding protein
MGDPLLGFFGASAVGKTALERRFWGGEFSTEYNPTWGSGSEMDRELDGETVKFSAMEYGGADECFSSLLSSIPSTRGFVLVYAINDRASFERIEVLHGHIIQIKGTPNVPIVICGNKIDLEDQRVVTTAEGEELASKLSASFFETSALSNANTDNPFRTVLRLLNSPATLVFEDKTFTYRPLTGQKVETVKAARRVLADELKLSKKEIEIYPEASPVSLQPSQFLYGGNYVVKRPKPRFHVVLALKPTPAVGLLNLFTRRLMINRDREGIDTVEDLLKRYFPQKEFPLSEPLKVLREDTEVNLSTNVNDIPPDSILTIEYPAPTADAVYECGPLDDESETRTIRWDETVADVKTTLIPSIPDVTVLLSVLKLKFWGIELRDSDSFSALGIPSGAKIEVVKQKTSSITVKLPDGSEREFVVADDDVVPSLMGRLLRIASEDVQKSRGEVTRLPQ